MATSSAITDSFLPNSNQICQGRRPSDGTRQEYFTQILRRTGPLWHNLAVGDICAVRQQDGHKLLRPLGGEEKVAIGQVLALYVQKESLDRISYHVVLRHLARWKLEGHYFAEKKTLKQYEHQFFRPLQALLETMKVQTYPLSHVQRIDIQIVPCKTLLDMDKLKFEHHAETQSTTLFFCCPYRIAETGKLYEVRTDWDVYETRRASANATTVSTHPPASLQRGWQLLSDKQLIQASQEAWQSRSALVFSVQPESKLTVSTDPGKENTHKRRKSQDLPAPKHSSLSIHSKKKQKLHQQQNQPQQQQQQHVRFAKGTRNGSSKTAAHSTRSESTTADTTNTTTTANDDDHDTVTATPSASRTVPASMASSLALDALPLGDAVYTTTTTNTTTSKANKSNRTMVFVDGVEMNVDDAVFHPLIIGTKRKRSSDSNNNNNNHSITGRWQFHVGDLVILRCPDTRPPQQPFVAKKATWFPFRVPWSVAQIVAIYYYRGGKGNHDQKTSDIFMQVRWFYRPDELDQAIREHFTDQQKRELSNSRMLLEVDEHIDEVPVESVIGLAKITSQPQPPPTWLRPTMQSSVPQLGFICRYAYLSKHDDPELFPVHDWTDYGSTSTGPLYRGLACPKGKPGTIPKLFKRYKEQMCRRLKINHLKASCFETDRAQQDDRVAKEWAPKDWECAQTHCDPTDCCHDDQHHEYFSSVQIQIVKERCDARGTAKKSEFQEITVSIGDFVCITGNVGEAKPPARDGRQKNPWFPYKGPFMYVQVLCIFRENKKRNSNIMLEVRRFLRRSEVDQVASKYLAPNSSRQQDEEEIYESCDVSVITAGRVLGMAQVFLGHHSESHASKNESTFEIVRPKCRCVFYLTTVGSIQRLFCADSTPRKWARRMLERGLIASKMIHDDVNLAIAIESYLGISIADTDKGDLNNIFLSLIQDAKKEPPCSRPIFKKNGAKASRSYFASASIEVPWGEYRDKIRLCSSRDRKECWWKICVGEVVAVRRNGHSGEGYYSTDWEPAQVIAIFCEAEENENSSMFRFIVRWLHRDEKASQAVFPGRITEIKARPNSTLSSSDLLGPVYLADDNTVSHVWERAIPYLPSNVALYENTRTFKLSTFVQKALETSTIFEQEELQLLYDALEREFVGFSAPPEQCESPKKLALELLSPKSSSPSATLSTPKPLDLIHTDQAGRCYYRKVVIEPSVDALDEGLRGQREHFDGPLSVELGDSVIVNYSYGCGPAKFGSVLDDADRKATKNYPFARPWAIGEVVSIFISNGNEVEFEARWFYRGPEIKGAPPDIKQSSRDITEEIFESDHYTSCPVSSILAPAIVHPRESILKSRNYHLGMPVIEFHSCRFWSPRRSSLIPVESSPLARMQRGRLYSPSITRDPRLRSVLEALDNCGMKTNSSSSLNWRESFHGVIEKLSLTDASKEGFKSSKAIVGRDKEMSQILSFLRTALKGDKKEGRCSLFIAGPPGVGKTACVRAAVSELQQLRARDQVPSFDFVAMNAMEMKYPFEAYVQLWEKISGQATSPEVAASRLEAYFTKQQLPAGVANTDARSVVVLLDEIDYLVTKNQSVLYNFFDWPTHNQQRRLIVLGVSNTLNLVEQLHTRVQSRIGSRRCIFRAYDAQQIETILRSKLFQACPGRTVFDDDAIVFVSKKTASLSGDIRRAFQICRTAAEYVLREHAQVPDEERGPLVMIRDAVKVSRESFHSAKSQAITRCTVFEALLLVSLASLSKSTGREFGGFDMEEILVKMESLANGLGNPRYLPSPTLAETMDVVARLAESNLVSAETQESTSLTFRASLAGSGGPWPLVSLVVDDLSVLLALKKSPHNALAQKFLGLGGF